MPLIRLEHRMLANDNNKLFLGGEFIYLRNRRNAERKKERPEHSENKERINQGRARSST